MRGTRRERETSQGERGKEEKGKEKEIGVVEGDRLHLLNYELIASITDVLYIFIFTWWMN